MLTVFGVWLVTTALGTIAALSLIQKLTNR